jgi:valyl-tRNA synthetase
VVRQNETLADAAIEAQNKGDVSFYPERWTKVYMSWLENVRDWCISRQIWWGHRIPAWQCKSCDEIIITRETPEKCTKCGNDKLVEETDVTGYMVQLRTMAFFNYGMA